ncbi:M81 family metallopeptidase, partial [Bordetella pertussis]|uniref:M81 family metallopeptidase n=1 Tax=Bordetella pertussis TaxID=520 RepID=UPI0018A6C6AE
MHILVAGFQHETNTFAPSKAGYDNFLRGEGFPALVRGDDLLALRAVNIPAGGFLNAALADGHSVHPVLWAGASPSAHVTRDAFERIAGEIEAAARAGRYDAVGPATPIVASLDLHANVTRAMLAHASAL